MHILIFNGSPRKNGNTSLILHKVIQGIHDQGGKAQYINLPEHDIHPCTGCGYCEKEGECIIDDDMQDLYIKIAVARRIVIGSPIYFYGVTAQAKAFIDRCQVFWSRKYLLGETNPLREERKGYLISVAATSGGKVFEGARLTAQYAFDAMDFLYNDAILVKGVDAEGEVLTKTETLERAYSFGQTLCD